MTHPPITLSRWHPLDLGVHRLSGPTTRTFDAEPPGATLLIDLDPRMAADRNLVTLHRAAQVNGLAESLFEPNHKLDGHPWYDRLPCVVAMDTEASIDGEKMAFTWTDDQSSNTADLQESVALLHGVDDEAIEGWDWETFESGRNAVAQHIVVRILVRSNGETEVRRLATDFGVGTEYEDSPESAGIIVTPGCTLGVDALKNLIAEAIYKHSFDEKADSRETQWHRFMDEAHTVAAKLLLNEHEGLAEAIRHAARNHLRHLLPDGRSVQLRKRPAPPGEQVEDIEVVILGDEETYGAWASKRG